MAKRPGSRGLLVAVFVVVGFAAAGLFVALLLAGGGELPWVRHPVLHIDLDGPVVEIAPRDPIAEMLGRRRLSMRDLLDGLEKASEDHAIEGLLLDIGSPSLGWAQIEELREAIRRFRENGKWATAYLDTAGELGGGNGIYLLATACDRIVLAPPGDVGLTGLRIETPFVRGLLDKLGVEPQFGQRKEFKNAVNVFTSRDYTPAHREATERLLDSLFASLVEGVASGRGLTPERVRELIDGGPYTSAEALEAGLVDEVAYRDEVLAKIESDTGSDDPLVPLQRYLRSGRPHAAGGHKIAVVYAVGQIALGRSRKLPTGLRVMGSETMTRALRRAREDRSVEAVVLRVDSPGGSYVASDLIRREVELTKREKPVIVSMGNVAASGGYFISMHADRILADTDTLTGSIGVYAGKFVTRRFWRDKLGINFGGIQRGANAEMMSSQEPFDERARARLEALLDRIYDDFVTKAAEGRGMTPEELEPLARGRVWTGRDALERGLVDEIGGLQRAIAVAAERAGIPEGAAIAIEVLPRPQTFLEALLDGNDDTLAALPAGAREALDELVFATEPGERWLFDPDLPRVR
ncbi:MAG: signal peptide peptidase SppA [Acidobacteria bacterium]|nr:MAG: signal peptide peptidase SppA [Acidobacteriota bacterium]